MKLVTFNISSLDFDAITDPIMKAKMVALKGINKVMAQNNLGMPPMVMNRWVKGFLTLPLHQEVHAIISSSYKEYTVPKTILCSSPASVTQWLNTAPGIKRSWFDSWLRHMPDLWA